MTITEQTKNLVIDQGTDFYYVFSYPDASSGDVAIAEMRQWAGGPLLATFSASVNTVAKTVELALPNSITANIKRAGVYEIIIQNGASAYPLYAGKVGLRIGATTGPGTTPSYPVGQYGSTKDPVRAVATTNITLSGTQSVDGVSLIADDPVLVAGQTDGTTNGIYLVASGAWTRRKDADTSAELKPGFAVWVSEGSVNHDSLWELQTDNPIVLGTTALTFAVKAGSAAGFALQSALTTEINRATTAEATKEKLIPSISDGNVSGLADGQYYVDETANVAGLALGTTAGTAAEGSAVVYKGDLTANIKDYGALADGSDSSAALTSACAASTDVFVPKGTYTFSTAPTIPSGTAIRFAKGARFLWTGTGTFFNLSGLSQVKFTNGRISLTAANQTAFYVYGSFRCSWKTCIIDGGHTIATGSTYATQIGFQFRNNAGDNRIIDCDLNNLGKAITTDSIQNYLIGSVVGTCKIGIHGDAGSFGAGMSVSDTTFVSTAAATDNHVLVDVDANAWWFANCWFEGATDALKIGSTTHGPVGFGMVNCKIAGSTSCLTLNASRQTSLVNVKFDSDSGQTPTELAINATNCPEGTAINLISKQSFDFATSVFPTGWLVMGRGVMTIPSVSRIRVNSPSGGATVPAEIHADGSQSVDLFQVWNSSGAKRIWVDNNAGFAVGNGSSSFSVGAAFGQAIINASGQTTIGKQDRTGTQSISPSTSDISLTLVGRATTSRLLALRALTSQTGDLAEWQDSSGNILGRIGPSGRLITGITTAPILADLVDGEVALSSDAAGRLVATGRSSGALTSNVLSDSMSRFVPWVIGGWYINPLVVQGRTSVLTQGRFYAHVFFSGPDGVTIDKLDCNVATVGSSGSVTRMGVYQVTNQSRPFAWSNGVAWASLLVDGGTVATDGSTGQKTITLGSALVIPANTWFAVGGADQVATPATRYVGGQAGGNWASAFGQTGSGGYGTSAGLSIIADSVTGALPATLTPTTLLNLDSGVGIHRSA